MQALGLFCELYAHLLSVLDDAALYERGDPLPLATTRAVALSLNALVFASHMARAGKSRLGPTAAAALAHAAAALTALQARHVRRALCPEGAWLAPWHAASARDPVRPIWQSLYALRHILPRQAQALLCFAHAS